jgi:acyl-CoA synthetase (AMP-forming)/AMP-acid ligase II
VPVLADVIRDTVRAHRGRTALVDVEDGVELTFGELDSLFDRIGAGLRAAGLGPGDHVAVFQRNSRYWVGLEGALAKAGMVTVPVNVYLASPEVLWLLDHAEAKAIAFTPDEAETLAPIAGSTATCSLFLCHPQGSETPAWAQRFDETVWPESAVDELLPVAPGDTHRIMYTSATTGFPKGVLIPSENWVGCIVTALANQLDDVGQEERVLLSTPLTHVAGNYFWAFFGRGATTVLLRQFRPEGFVGAVVRHRITHAFLAPTMIVMLLEHLKGAPAEAQALRASELRRLWYAGSPIPEPVALEAENLLGPILGQHYGLTEVYSTYPTMAVTQLHPEWHRRKPGSCGRPIVGTVIRVVDDAGKELPPGELGEIVIRCQSRVAGYWRGPADGQGAYRAGWIHTGDVGTFDDEGFLYVKDRKNDLIISGGLNVYPAEVESVLHEHPAVAQCAVVGVSDPKWLEVPWAVVVRSAGAGDVGEDELIAFVRTRIASFKTPKRVIFAESLPVTTTGKLLRRQLRETLRESAGAAG